MTIAPAGSCDCHVHVFAPDRYAYDPDRTYTPGAARPADLRRFLQRLRLGRVVLVQPSVYGTDNRLLLETIAELGSERTRAIAVIDPASVTDDELERLNASGVRGVRLNAGVKADVDPVALESRFRALSGRIRGSGWMVQLHAPLALVTAISGALAHADTTIVLDHFAGAFDPVDRTAENIATIVALLRTGLVYVKLSASYRIECSARARDLEIADLAGRLIEAAPRHVLWGSDWPHTGSKQTRRRRRSSDIEPFQEIDDAKALAALATWAGDETALRRILVDNPRRLFGFEA